MGRRILFDFTGTSAMAPAAAPSFERDGSEANQTRATFDPPVRKRDKFNPTLAVVISVLILSFFLVGFAARYFKHWILGNEATEDSSNFPRRRRTSRPRKASETGLDPEVLSALPLVQYADLLRAGKCSEDCPVCLTVFHASDSLRVLPECAHAFHSGCIDEWFKTHSTCPLCRASLAKSEMEGASTEDHGAEGGDVRRQANFDIVQVVISGETSGAAAAISGSSREAPTVANAEDQDEAAQVHAASFIRAVRNGASPAAKEPIQRSSSVGRDLQLRPYIVDSEGTQHHGINFHVHALAIDGEMEKIER